MSEKFTRAGFVKMSSHHNTRVADYEASTGVLIDEIEEKSAGCIVFARNGYDGEVVVLIIENHKHKLGFPKGHVREDGEDDVTGAIREVHEETGVLVRAEELIHDTKSPQRDFYTHACKLHSDAWQRHADFPDKSKRPLVVGHKTVIYYTAIISEPRPVIPQLEEVSSAEWMKVREALQVKSLKHLLQGALSSPAVRSLFPRGPSRTPATASATMDGMEGAGAPC